MQELKVFNDQTLNKALSFGARAVARETLKEYESWRSRSR